MQRFQAFGITALVHTVSMPRSVNRVGRMGRDVVSDDGSKTQRRDAETLVEAVVMPTFQVFSGSEEAAMMTTLEAAAGKHIPHHMPWRASQTGGQWLDSNHHAELCHL